MTSIDVQNPPLAKKKTARKTPGHVIKITQAFIISVVILLALAYLLMNMQWLKKESLTEKYKLQEEIALLKQQQIATQSLLNTTSNTLHASQTQLKTQFNTLEQHLQAALQQHQFQTSDWLLLRVRYYLELAQINAQWSDNIPTTLALLQQADRLLTEIHDQGALNIRQSIAKEISQLQSLPTLDKTGLLSQLTAARAQIAKLPLKSTMASRTASASSSEKTAATWRDRLKQSVGLLEELVVIRHQSEAIEPLPSPAYEAMLREECRLHLQEAEWAVLHTHEDVYQLSLQQTLNTIQRAFAMKAPETEALIQQVQRLQHIHLPQQKPMLGQSLSLLNQYLQSKNTTNPLSSSTKNEPAP